MRALAVALGAAALAACAASPPPLPAGREPTAALAPRPGPKLALVLSSGGARAFAHVGVIAGLEGMGLAPDLVVGSSGGALVGAVYAHERSAARLAQLMRDTDWSVMFPGALATRFGAGARSAEFEAILRGLLGEARIEALPLEFAASATDLRTGEQAVFVAGDAARAVRASGAAPGRFLPVEIRGLLYADGALASPVPVQAARALGADFVIAVDVTYPPRDAAPVDNLTDLVYQAFHIQAARITAWELERADVVIRPRIPPTTETYTDRDRAMLVTAGAEAVRAQREALAEIAHYWRRVRGRALGRPAPPERLVQLHRDEDRERHPEQPRP